MVKLLKSDIILFFSVFLFLDTLFRLRMWFSIVTVFSFSFTVLLLMVLCSVISCFSKKIRLILEYAIILVFTVLCFTQSVHNTYFNVLYSFEKLALINELSGVMESVFSKISIFDFVLFLPVCFMTFSLKKIKSAEEKTQLKHIPIYLLISVSCIFCFNYLTNHIPSSSNWAEDMSYNYENLSNKNQAAEDFGLITYSLLDGKKVIERMSRSTDQGLVEEIDAFVNAEGNSITSNELTGIFEGMNLIVIQAESLSSIALNETVMPTLSMMAENGISFTNFYAPIYQSATADTEFIVNTSLIPSINSGPTAYTYENNHYDYSLANLLKTSGYSAASYHSYYRVFYNRELLHGALGFSTFLDKEALGIIFPENYEDGINWPSDEELMWRMMKKLPSPAPFFSFVICASGHMPYVGYRSEFEPDYYRLSQIINEDDEMLSYYSAQSLFDRSLNTLLSILDENNLSDNTVIVVYGDHYPYGLSEQKQDLYFSDDIQKYKVPCIIYCKNKEISLKVDKLMSSFDLLPTITNLLGIESKGYHVGVDVFSDENSIVYFYDRSWLTENGLNDLSIAENVKNVFEISQKMLEMDYYGK